MTRFANLLGELSSLILLFAIESLSLIFIEIESTRMRLSFRSRDNLLISTFKHPFFLLFQIN